MMVIDGNKLKYWNGAKYNLFLFIPLISIYFHFTIQDLHLSNSFQTNALAPTMAALPAFSLEGRSFTLLR